MKREIKFRGYNTDIKKFIYGSLVNNVWRVAGTDQDICEIVTTDKVENYYDCWDDMKKNGNIVRIAPESVGQFTGHTDVNGKEIYEGDILETYNRKGGRSPKNVKVYWNEYALSFSIKTIEKDGGESLGMPLNNPFLKVGKIIGNIFENPELLKP